MCWNIEHLRTGGKQINAENRQRNTNGWNEKKIGNYIHMRIRNLYLYFYPWADLFLKK